MNGIGGLYILNGDNVPVAEEDALIWAKWFESYHASGRPTVTVINERVRVSTTFLGISRGLDRNGSPVLWETMVFDRNEPGDSRHCSSHADAMAVHALVVEYVTAIGAES